MKKLTSLFLGILSGALTGATLALLFAPSSGEQLKRQLSDGFDQMVQDVRQAATDRRQELEIELDKLRSPSIKIE